MTNENSDNSTNEARQILFHGGLMILFSLLSGFIVGLIGGGIYGLIKKNENIKVQLSSGRVRDCTLFDNHFFFGTKVM